MTQHARIFRHMVLWVGTEDKHIAGILSQTPGRLWRYVTVHLKTIQSPINHGYFDVIQYVKVPAFWSTLLNPAQLQHGNASISDKEVNQDGWARCVDAATMPPELLKRESCVSITPCSSLLTRFQMVTPPALHSRSKLCAPCRS